MRPIAQSTRKHRDMNTLLGYLGSWSATNAHRQTQGHDPKEIIFSELQSAWGQEDAQRKINWSLTVRVARKNN